MTFWTAIIPLKSEGVRKSRLAAQLDLVEREKLAQQLFIHVVRTVQHCPSIRDVLIVSDAPPAIAGVRWRIDSGGGLNAALTHACASIVPAPRLIIHADLPLLTVADVETLLEEAESHGVAMAPDRYGTGTNALALAQGENMRLSFGQNSFALHKAQRINAAYITNRQGLSLDIDTPADLAESIRGGFRLA